MKKLLLGLLGGISLGMLFAPEKGDKLRNKLSKSDEKLKDFGKELLSAGKNASDEVKKFVESEKVQDFFEKGKSNVSELLNEGKNLSVKGQKELRAVVEKVKDKVGNIEKDQILGDIKNFFSSEKSIEEKKDEK